MAGTIRSRFLTRYAFKIATTRLRNRTQARTVKGLLFLLNVEPEGKFPEARIGSSLLEVKPIITKVFPRPVGPESRSRAKGQAQFHQ